MNQHVINRIAQRHAQARVGQEPIKEPDPGFIQVDPEWSKLKRLEILKVNWGRLYGEAKQHVTDKNLFIQIEQAYTSFRNWTAPYRGITDVLYVGFDQALTRQMIIFDDFRNKVLPFLHRKGKVSQTIPGPLIHREGPKTLSSPFSGMTGNFGTGLLILGAFWVLMNARSGNK